MKMLPIFCPLGLRSTGKMISEPIRLAGFSLLKIAGHSNFKVLPLSGAISGCHSKPGGTSTPSKLSKVFRKLLKMHYYCIFFNIFSKPCVNFRAFGGKTQIVGKLLENVDIF